MSGSIHYEVYVRKTAPAPWSLLMATEDRGHAVQTAEELLKDDRAAAVRVTKETMDPASMEFNSVTILTRGAPEVQRKRVIPETEAGPRCGSPRDFYQPLSRELIGRSLENWLTRQGVTVFELLHRPDLAERLDAAGVEMQHGIQKIAVPESQAVGQPVHDLIRHYQKLADQAVEQLIAAGRRNLFPSLEDRSIADIAHRLAGKADRGFIMGGVVCGALKGMRNGRDKIGALLDILDRAPMDGPPRALVTTTVEQILCEILAARTSLADLLGPGLDQGASLAAVVRMMAPREVEAVLAAAPKVAALIPRIDGPAARLGERVAAGELPLLCTALAKMVVRELMSPRRLRPGNAEGEIEILRALASLLAATAGRLLTHEEIQQAFTERSRALVTADFVAAYAEGHATVVAEAEALARLCENVTGLSNKRAAARWLAACVGSLRFETEMRAPGGAPPGQRLLVLAQLQRTVHVCDLPEREELEICARLGAVGAQIEEGARIVQQLTRAVAPIPHKLAALLRMAAGDTAPLGPAAERARAEAVKLLRAPDARAELAGQPETIANLKPLMQAAGLAA